MKTFKYILLIAALALSACQTEENAPDEVVEVEVSAEVEERPASEGGTPVSITIGDGGLKTLETDDFTLKYLESWSARREVGNSNYFLFGNEENGQPILNFHKDGVENVTDGFEYEQEELVDTASGQELKVEYYLVTEAALARFSTLGPQSYIAMISGMPGYQISYRFNEEINVFARSQLREIIQSLEFWLSGSILVKLSLWFII